MGFEVVPIIGLTENAYLLKGEHPALVDTMVTKSFKRIVRVLGDHGLSVGDIEFVLITHNHFDHAGNAARIKELSGATLIAGAEDAGVIEGTELIPAMSDINRLGRTMGKLPDSWVRKYQKFDHVKIDRKVEGGDVIEELGLEVLGLPGHTSGGVGYLDRPRKRAFIGDMVSYFFGKPGMPALSASKSLDDIYRSQELLADLDLMTAYPGHGKIIEPEASKIIGTYLVKKRG
jgi:glyoxylase-like metal-dependent hydrolase (beta-lactamase superfamily II)